MINVFLALQRIAEQRGDGLLPELADRLRKMPRLDDGHLITINGDDGEQKLERNGSLLRREAKGDAARVSDQVGNFPT